MVAVQAASGNAVEDVVGAISAHVGDLTALLATGAAGRKLDDWISYSQR
jgi:hypothetical protein